MTEQIRYGTFGPIVWDTATGDTRMATQRDLDHLPQGDDLTEAEEATIDGDDNAAGATPSSRAHDRRERN